MHTFAKLSLDSQTLYQMLEKQKKKKQTKVDFSFICVKTSQYHTTSEFNMQILLIEKLSYEVAWTGQSWFYKVLLLGTTL